MTDVPPGADDPLAGLRDIHLPAEPGWWPPASGWWLLAALAAAGAAWGWARAVRRRRALAPRRAALRELAALEARLGDGDDPARIIADLSALLRRAALARFPDEPIAGHTGQRWLEFLDAHGGGGRFRDGPGAALVEAPYVRVPQLDAGPVLELVRAWLAAGAWPSRRC